FIEPNVRLEADKPPLRAIEAMNDWLAGPEQTALVLGEFGSGKSTTLAEWASRLWRSHRGLDPSCATLPAPASRLTPSSCCSSRPVLTTPRRTGPRSGS